MHGCAYISLTMIKSQGPLNSSPKQCSKSDGWQLIPE